MTCHECGGSGRVLDAPDRVLAGRPYYTECPECAMTNGNHEPEEPRRDITESLSIEDVLTNEERENLDRAREQVEDPHADPKDRDL